MKKILVILTVLVVFAGCKPTKLQELFLDNVSVLSNGIIHIEGRAKGAFENTVGIKIMDSEGILIFQGPSVTDAKEPNKLGKFSSDIELPFFPQTDTVKVECFIESAKDGSILESKEKNIDYNMPYKIVKVYFSNEKENPEMLDCSKVYPVERRVSLASKNAAIDTLKLLILGPTQKEKDSGYILTTPQNLTINFVRVEGNKVQVDFSSELLSAGGGSCRVIAIRAEITETVRQFYPAGYEVIISANGNWEEVLQP